MAKIQLKKMQFTASARIMQLCAVWACDEMIVTKSVNVHKSWLFHGKASVTLYCYYISKHMSCLSHLTSVFHLCQYCNKELIA